VVAEVLMFMVMSRLFARFGAPGAAGQLPAGGRALVAAGQPGG
jgi:hypothetical protein